MGSTGKTVGTVGGAALGTAVAGPVGGIVGGFLGGTLGGLFDSDDTKPKPPPVDPMAFERPDASAAAQGYTNTGYDYQNRGAAALQYGRDQAATTNQAAALGYNNAQTQAANQTARGQQLLQNQQMVAGAQNTAGRQAATRTNPTMDLSGMQNAQAAQYQALGGVANQATQGADTTALRNYYQQGPGPSAAQAQLQQGSEASMAQALALSRSGRNGTNAAAERQAMFQNAATMAQTNQQAAQLRAQEAQAWRGQQLNAMTAEQQAIAQGRGAQLQALGIQQQALSGIGNQQLASQQAAANLALAGRAQNDQTALAYGQLSNQSQALGYQTALGYGQLSNQTQGMGNAYQLGMGGLANQQQALGSQTYLGAGQLGLGYEGMAEASIQADRAAAMQREALTSGQQLSQNQFNANMQAQQDAANMGMAMGATNALAQYAGQQQQANASQAAAQGAAAGASAYNSGNDPYGIGSDERVKRDVRPLPDMGRTFAALGGPPATAGVPRRDVDYAALDAAQRGPEVDLRPAQGYVYQYKDPTRFGQGQYAGPMAQDLERSPATAGTVYTGPDGVKRIDPDRLALVNTSALSEQQRRLDELEAALGRYDREKNATRPAKRPRQPASAPEEPPVSLKGYGFGIGEYYRDISPSDIRIDPRGSHVEPSAEQRTASRFNALERATDASRPLPETSPVKAFARNAVTHALDTAALPVTLPAMGLEALGYPNKAAHLDANTALEGVDYLSDPRAHDPEAYRHYVREERLQNPTAAGAGAMLGDNLGGAGLGGLTERALAGVARGGAGTLARLGAGAGSRSKKALASAEFLKTQPEADALREYMRAGYDPINHTLRADAGVHPSGFPESTRMHARAKAEQISSMLGRAEAAGLNQPGTVLRGLELPAGTTEKWLQHGAVENRSFWSTTANPRVAEEFTTMQADSARPEKVLLRIKQKSAVPVGGLNGGFEDELLLPPGKKWQIIGHEKTDGGATIIDLKQVDKFKPGTTPVLSLDGDSAAGFVSGRGRAAIADQARRKEDDYARR